MSKGLKALVRLSAVASMYCDECATSEEDLDRGMFEKDYQAVKTIENELKEKEKQDDYIQSLEDRIDNLETSYLRVKKAFDIIKEKKVNVSLLLHTKNYYDYNDHVVRAQIYLQSNTECLTQEEWAFLKEVLL